MKGELEKTQTRQIFLEGIYFAKVNLHSFHIMQVEMLNKLDVVIYQTGKIIFFSSRLVAFFSRNVDLMLSFSWNPLCPLPHNTVECYTRCGAESSIKQRSTSH